VQRLWDRREVGQGPEQEGGYRLGEKRPMKVGGGGATVARLQQTLMTVAGTLTEGTGGAAGLVSWEAFEEEGGAPLGNRRLDLTLVREGRGE